MPSIGVKLYSVFFKFMLKHRLQSRLQALENDAVGGSGSFGVTSRPDEETAAAANPSFTEGVATKDIHIDAVTSLSLRVFLPDTCLHLPETRSKSRVGVSSSGSDENRALVRRYSYGSSNNGVASSSNGGVLVKRAQNVDNSYRRNSYGCSIDDSNLKSENGIYRGYKPVGNNFRRLPIMLQFHGGGFVSGSNDSVANDFFCRRIARLCDVIVLAVGYRLAPENKYPAAFEDGLKVLHWLAKQANLAECGKSLGGTRGGVDLRRSEANLHVADAFGASMVEPWLAAHGDPSRVSCILSVYFGDPKKDLSELISNVILQGSRCVLLGVSCGGNIADYVARKAVEAGKLLDPVKVVAQVLMYPFFIGSIPTHSEIKMANSYFYDKAMCILAWKLFLSAEEFSLDHPAANPLVPGREGPPLKKMPPTLTVVAEHDSMRDRAIAYSEELRKVNVDAPVLEYKDAVHEFATLDMLLKTPQAQACAEDIAIWVKKYISLRGHEFSY
ncbi:UNVERIFIED_CONTAM: putative carboxylesterase 11 [Sesamum latifolium]|uniref:Carboxylesterase 11 n=2 Tax=Sesamum TaxID=4181 RepID=A0AAW2Y7W8_9LAMI